MLYSVYFAHLSSKSKDIPIREPALMAEEALSITVDNSANAQGSEMTLQNT